MSEELPPCKRCKHPGEAHDREWSWCDRCYNDCGYEPHTDPFFDVNGFSRVKVDRG